MRIRRVRSGASLERGTQRVGGGLFHFGNFGLKCYLGVPGGMRRRVLRRIPWRIHRRFHRRFHQRIHRRIHRRSTTNLGVDPDSRPGRILRAQAPKPKITKMKPFIPPWDPPR